MYNRDNYRSLYVASIRCGVVMWISAYRSLSHSSLGSF